MNRNHPAAGSKRAFAPRHHCFRRLPAARLRAVTRGQALAISLLLITGTLLPSSASAFSMGDFFLTIRDNIRHSFDIRPGTLQTMPIASAATNLDPSGVGGGDITIIDDSALLPDEGPAGTLADIGKSKNSTISTYVVRPGDTISTIAALFDVSPNTILWANDLSRTAALTIGQKLVILPVTGVTYTVKSGDTLASIAKKFRGDADEIANYNGVDMLLTGDEIIIPDGEIPVLTAKVKTSTAPAHGVGAAGTLIEIGYYLRPVYGIHTQGIHGYNGVDIAAPVGTPIFASASGDVIVAKGAGYNGGYGAYVVIQHNNGSQTLYAHASKVVAYIGEHVEQGGIIAYVGRTGKATGSHVHFEIRNGIRNPF